ncbi:MAG: c-type cytochrome [Candidatus Zixiibacteriota bacterium]|nr:MAG: c-type cytochrome [candidate division Zixibacteria bacterium]
MVIISCSSEPKQAEATSLKQQIERGEYLVNIGGCHHCHSPKIMTDKGPEIDPDRILSGHRSSSATPGVPPGIIGPESWGALTNRELTAWAGPWGVSFASNLTPDEVTGIGAWLESSFIQAMRNGKHLGTGRPILPPMPWQDIGRLSDDDLQAIFAYLKSLKPINNMVPLPIAPDKMTRSSM